MLPGSLPPLEPVDETRGLGRLVRQMAISLLIWLGVNAAVFMGVSLAAFWAFRTLSIRQETAFTYSVICAVPAALIAGSVVAGRRVLRMMKD